MILLSNDAILELEAVFGTNETFYNWQTHEQYEDICYAYNDMLEEDATGKNSIDYIASNILTQLISLNYSLDRKTKLYNIEIASDNILLYVLLLDFMKPFDFYYNKKSNNVQGTINATLYKLDDFLKDLCHFIRNVERQIDSDSSLNYDNHFEQLTIYELCDTINNILLYRNLSVSDFNSFDTKTAAAVKREVNTYLCILIISIIRFGDDDVNYPSKQSEVELKRLVGRLKKSTKFNKLCHVSQIETIFNMLNIKLNTFTFNAA